MEKPQTDYDQVMHAALKLLGRRMYTCFELTKKLKDKEIGTPALRGQVLRRLQELKLIDDREYAASWIRSRSIVSPRGVYLLRRELTKKKVAPEVISAALADTPVDERALALRVAQKKLTSLQRLTKEQQYARILGLLQRKGFGYDIARRTWEAIQ